MISATSLSSSRLPSCAVPGSHAPPGTCRIASSSLPVIIHPQVNSSVFLGDDSVSRCLTRSWLAPAPSIRTRTFRRNPAGTCLSALSSTSL